MEVKHSIACLLIRLASIIDGSRQEQGTNGYNNAISAFGGQKRSQMVYPYGMFAKPPTGTLCVSMLNGNEDNTLSMPIMPGKSQLPNVQDDDVVLGNPQSGDYISFSKQDGIKIYGKVTITGDVTVSGTVTGDDCKTASGISLKTHKHAQPPLGTGDYVDGNGNPVTGDSGTPTVTP